MVLGNFLRVLTRACRVYPSIDTLKARVRSPFSDESLFIAYLTDRVHPLHVLKQKSCIYFSDVLFRIIGIATLSSEVCSLIPLEIVLISSHIPFGAKAIVEDTIHCSRFLSVPLTSPRFLKLFVYGGFLLLAGDGAKQDYDRIE